MKAQTYKISNDKFDYRILVKDIFLTGVGEQGEDVDGKMVEEAFKMNKSESFEIILHR